MDISTKYVLSISGGGIRGIAHIGVLKRLEETGVMKQFHTFAGTSIGAVIACMLVLGFNSTEIMDLIFGIDFGKLFQFNNIGTLIESYGFDKGARFDYMFKQVLHFKGFDTDITLKELYDKTKLKLIMSVTNVTTNKGEYWDYQNTPDIMVRTAARASCCIPILLAPIQVNGSLYVDGGCSIHIPLQPFTIEEVLLINLRYPFDETPIDSLETYLLKIIKTMYTYFQKIDDIYDIIDINITVSAIDFHIDNIKKQELFDIGYTKCKEIIDKSITD